MPSLSDPHEPLDALILRSLGALAVDLRGAPWFGRENELVNHFVFGHLLKLAALLPGVLSPGQIGIEVAVPQLLDWGERPKKYVRKDLVIWPASGSTCWAGPCQHGEAPLAVMEWKTLNNVGVPERVAEKRAEHLRDIEWLTRMSRRSADCWGYAVFVDLRTAEKSIECQRVRDGSVMPVESLSA